MSSRIIVPSRKRLIRFGASRKSSADRDGGVSTMIRSHCSLARSWPSFSIAMYSCVPANEERQGLVEGVGQDLLRPARASSARRRCRRTSASCPASSRAARPSAPGTSTRRGSLSSSVQAERLGQPPGRVDGEDDDAAPGLRGGQRQRGRRRRLAHAAGAAADDDPGVRVGDQRAEVQRGRLGGGRGRSAGAAAPTGSALTRPPRVRRCSSSRPASSNSAPRSIGPVSSGSSTVGRPSASTSSRSASCAAHRWACSTASAARASATASSAGRCAAASAGARSAPVSPAVGGPGEAVGRAAPARWPCSR